MKDLVEQYTKTRKTLEESKVGATEKDISIINEMISDINYALEWMRTAKEPGAIRGIERRAAYQRNTAVNPLLMQKYLRSAETLYEWDDKPKENVITEWERIKLEDALSTLTENEREIYIMFKGNCLSMDKISKLMKVSKGTIQKSIQRSDVKIARQLEGSLFCMI
ncbi:sigma factor-like helix-turn-helix DNA-binding protein [Bacillus thuringiensis]|uniref:RNA polymerase subunit sigma-24 n=1 Tax=Bacillus thuringiensis TaxID=1428 RepID=A0A9W3VGP7_BACTU|nr:sigma factor-like helix-turn-helix DNA-binding protein [Bacillus thuringiensis]AMR06450.1 RNA polymerase subunit sigma-24 [Bacillus thuringiensis]AYF85017.1 RNA polymerase subunit sigma-24 [Bacillus thuringiensis]PNK33119.1 RNA polymerase subunit sigma-24 [Bacillus thuringiensis]PRT08728.1 RNA polymerase subunit sigma-24 [Bacillus thuringiensis]